MLIFLKGKDDKERDPRLLELIKEFKGHKGYLYKRFEFERGQCRNSCNRFLMSKFLPLTAEEQVKTNCVYKLLGDKNKAIL